MCLKRRSAFWWGRWFSDEALMTVFHRDTEGWEEILRSASAWGRSTLAKRALSFPAKKGSRIAPEAIRLDWICLSLGIEHRWYMKESAAWSDFKSWERDLGISWRISASTVSTFFFAEEWRLCSIHSSLHEKNITTSFCVYMHLNTRSNFFYYR